MIPAILSGCNEPRLRSRSRRGYSKQFPRLISSATLAREVSGYPLPPRERDIIRHENLYERKDG